jgi:hypothetical protein
MNSMGAAIQDENAERHLGLRVAVVLFALVTGVLFGWMFYDLDRHYPHTSSFRAGQIVSPVLALELAGNITDLDDVFHNRKGKEEQEAAVTALERNTNQDCFFILCYTGELVSLALLFTAGQPARNLRWIAVASAVLAGLFDYAENYGIFQAIAAQKLGPGHLTDDLARHISYPSLEKWTTLGITLLILTAAVWSSQLPRQRSKANLILTISFGVGGLLLLTAIQCLPLFPFANLWFGGTLLLAAVHILWTLVRHRNGGVPGRSVQ